MVEMLEVWAEALGMDLVEVWVEVLVVEIGLTVQLPHRLQRLHCS